MLLIFKTSMKNFNFCIIIAVFFKESLDKLRKVIQSRHSIIQAVVIELIEEDSTVL